jgi:hypothetical protein
MRKKREKNVESEQADNAVEDEKPTEDNNLDATEGGL